MHKTTWVMKPPYKLAGERDWKVVYPIAKKSKWKEQNVIIFMERKMGRGFRSPSSWIEFIILVYLK